MNFINLSNLDYAVPYQLGFQDPASPLMYGLINLHHHIMFFLVIVLFFVLTMLYYVLSSFSVISNSNLKNFLKIKSLYAVKFSHNTTIEVIWTIIPTLILLVVAIPSFSLLYGFESFMDSNISIKVIGHQWYWSYECVTKIQSLPVQDKPYYNFKSIKINFDSYMVPTEDLKPNELRLLEVTNPLVIPVNTYIKVYITASDVIHSWAVPSLGVKSDAIPGRLNEVMCYIDRIGRYYGQCSELCGVNHGFMPILIYGVSKNDYLLYCMKSTDDLFNYFTNCFFVKNESISSVFVNWKDIDDIYLYSNDIMKFVCTNFAYSFVNCVKNY